MLQHTLRDSTKFCREGWVLFPNKPSLNWKRVNTTEKPINFWKQKIIKGKKGKFILQHVLFQVPQGRKR